MIKELYELLQKELKLYESALRFAGEKIKIIEEKDIKNLEKITKKEENLIIEIKRYEKKRISITENLRCSTLEEVVAVIEDEKMKKQISSIREKLLITINGIKSKNEMSRKLIDVSNGMLNKYFEEVSGRKEFGYDQNKQKSTISSTNIFNTKV